ncbi:hypothetical protein [Chryseobacterium taiwanense]|uniref:Uncharacterized protein n=1 Tax=Chryseobacterium taiwanense TaxID=363331 RepID=A0A0B4CKM5_9FLAO|nr:hypothetical protein [Chryseobacterium taiwanense]KIC61784.1 hypothetical protein RM51_15475 [Chryseobacterium taiwanense]
MKKILIHTVPMAISFLWLLIVNHTFNPISLRGPDFLKFYLMLVFGFYLSVVALQVFKENFSKTTVYFMISIFLLGVIKLIKGILLGKPVGFLIMILVMEIIVILFIKLSHINQKMN